MDFVFAKWLRSDRDGNRRMGWNLPAQQRYELTLRTIAAQAEAWYLRDAGGDTLTFDFGGKIHVCIWPTKESAQRYLDETRSRDQVCPIPYGELLKTVANLAGDSAYRLAVYPAGKDFWVIEPETFLEDLKNTAEQAETQEEKA